MGILDDLNNLKAKKLEEMALLNAEVKALEVTIKIVAKEDSSDQQPIISPAPVKAKATAKELIIGEVIANPGIDRAGVQANLNARGLALNATTLATTLSKAVGKELEKFGGGYRHKSESPGATGLSSATESSGS